MRKLATIRKIDAITPIENADAIECATVGGWRVVIKKGEFQVGQLATYFEIDSWIPEPIAPFLCQDRREYQGVVGARLRTVKLRGQISQGLLIPVADPTWQEGDDVTDLLGVQKYEAPVPAQLSGMVRGDFPSRIPKTDQERIQNLGEPLRDWIAQNFTWEVTEKLDGTSMTVYWMDGQFGVCSRNLDLLETSENTLWRIARERDMEAQLRALGRDLALQGELIGENIQKNPYLLKGQDFYLFDVYDIKQGRRLNATERQALNLKLKHAPVLDQQSITSDSIAALLQQAEGKSALNPKAEREGLVFKCLERDISFKAISNKFLLKHE
jgi:RNA ligase (TIGR02306 family)